MSHTASPPSSLARILSPRQLVEILGISPATLWRLRERDELPPPVRLSPGRVGWPEDQIRGWLAARGGQAHTPEGVTTKTKTPATRKPRRGPITRRVEAGTHAKKRTTLATA